MWFGAVSSLAATSADARLADRPSPALGPADGYCCPYGLGQWQGRPHRFVHADAAEASSPADTSILDGPSTAGPVVDETHGSVGAQHGAHDFYGDIDGSNFDCPHDAWPCHTARPDRPDESDDSWQADQRDEDAADDAAWGDETFADWRYCAGHWVVDQLNAEQDGLDETQAVEPDWAAMARKASLDGSPVSLEGDDDSPRCGDEQEDMDGADGDWFAPPGAPRRLRPVQPPSVDEDDTYRGPYHRTQVDKGASEPGRFRQWCGQLWQTIQEAGQEMSRRLGRLAEGAIPASEARPSTHTTAEPAERQAVPAGPPLPDYFLPAFGSPWDGEQEL
jgi:hypothetical protein